MAHKVMEVSHRAARVNIEKLVEQGLLVEIRKSGRTRRFVAREIIRVINGEAACGATTAGSMPASRRQLPEFGAQSTP